ncbi:hypothetical protein [Methylobacterium sp. GC_Met_2]|nr:hypothetical protein [Methylobacterium sp. GC_Met_2]
MLSTSLGQPVTAALMSVGVAFVALF